MTDPTPNLPATMSRGRRRLAVVLAPAIIPLLSMSRYNYLQNQPVKYWQDVGYFALLAYAGSALAGIVVFPLFRLSRRPPNAWAIVLVFTAACAAWGFASGFIAAVPSLDEAIETATAGMIAGLLISPLYCAIAGVPWRLNRKAEPGA